jgi:recombinational DNA repair protein (RecF pathway)
MNLEGILIHKTPYKERDIIGKLLLRSGKVVNLYFYGGRGGGKYNKGSILEIGHVLKFTLAPSRKKIEGDIKVAKEYNLLWEPNKIRTNYQAFYLLSLYAEIIQRIAITDELDNEKHHDEHSGLFKTLSNGIFCLDKAIEIEQYSLYQQLFIFLSKLILDLGILPDYEQCSHCHIELDKVDLASFEPRHGGFTCRECVLSSDQFISDNMVLFEELKNSIALRNKLKLSLFNKFTDFSLVGDVNRAQCNALFNYFCYQFQIQPSSFKTWTMLGSL